MFLNRLSFVYGIIACFLWGLAPILMKLVVSGEQALSPTSTVFWRFMFSALISLPWLPGLFRKRQHLFTYKMILCPISLVITFLIQVYALQKVPASLYVLVFGLTPLLSVFIEKKSNKIKYMGLLAVAFVGIIIFSDFKVSDLNSQGTGVLFLFLSLLGWMGSLWLMANTPKVVSSFEFTAFSQFVSVIFFLPVYFIEQKGHFSLINFSSGFIIFSTSAVLMLAMVLFHYGMVRFPGATILTQFLEPIFGVGLAVIFLSDKFGPKQMGGTVIIMSALYFIFKQQSNTKQT